MTKLKVSLTLEADVVRMVDDTASNMGSTRSGVIESWLRRASRQVRLARLEEDTAAYYASLTVAETEEDAALARASSRATRRLQIDDRGARGVGEGGRPLAGSRRGRPRRRRG